MAKGASEELLETPQLTTKMDNLSILNELIAQREEEVEQLRQELTNLSAKITSERAQWSQQRSEQEHQLRIKLQELEDKWVQRMQEAEDAVRTAGQSLQVQRDMEREVEKRIEELAQQKQALADLSKERLEIAFLRKQVEERSNEVESRWSASQHALTTGSDAYSRAEKMVQEVEARNLRLNQLDTEIRQREDQVALKEKQVVLANQELDKRLGEFKTVSADTSAQVSTTGFVSSTEGNQPVGGENADRIG